MIRSTARRAPDIVGGTHHHQPALTSCLLFPNHGKTSNGLHVLSHCEVPQPRRQVFASEIGSLLLGAAPHEAEMLFDLTEKLLRFVSVVHDIGLGRVVLGLFG